MITVLRLGHRQQRDQRLSTHVGLVARAFGADDIIYSGEPDGGLIESVKKTVDKWGGPFSVKYEKNWRKVLMNFEGLKIHLTMYGLPLKNKINEIIEKTKNKNMLVIVGSEKVDKEVYDAADFNIAVTSQPHSEVGALAVFFHEFFKGEELCKEFKDAKLKVIPSEKDKKVTEI